MIESACARKKLAPAELGAQRRPERRRLAAGSWRPLSPRRVRRHRRVHRRSAGSPSAGSHARAAAPTHGSPRRPPGRPGRLPAYVHRFRTNWRCQPSSVSGRTKNDRLFRPSSWPAAARKTRSRSSSRGREIWRRRTASSCRSTTISSSLNSRERSRSAATASARRNNRYSNDTTKKQPPPLESEKADSTAATRLRGASNQRMDLRTRQASPTTAAAAAAVQSRRPEARPKLIACWRCTPRALTPQYKTVIITDALRTIMAAAARKTPDDTCPGPQRSGGRRRSVRSAVRYPWVNKTQPGIGSARFCRRIE